MASEYLRQKAKREYVPAEPPRELTKKEKALNWLHYNKLWLIAAAVLIWIAGSMLWNILGIGVTRPDFIIAYIGPAQIPDEEAQKLEHGFSELGFDLNGDGKCAVELRRYYTDRQGDPETAMYYNYAADTGLIADITKGDSIFFITDNPKKIQRSYQIFAADDGSMPDDFNFEAMDRVYLWGSCPALGALELDPEIFDGLYIGRRGFFDEKQAAEHAGCETVWAAITQGAVR